MRLETLEQKVRTVREVLGNIDFDFYATNIWEDVVRLQGVLVQEVREEIERAGFELVRSFRGGDRTTYYIWRKDGVEIALHTLPKEEGDEVQDL